jgi:YVTN family beta-propeller protein
MLVVASASPPAAQALPLVVATIPVGDHPDGIAVSPDGTKVYVVNNFSLDVSVIDTATNTVVATFANPGGNVGQPRDVAFTPDGTEVWVSGGGCVDCIRIFAYPTNAPVATVGGVPGGGDWIGFLPDGSFSFVNNGCGGCGNLQKISTTTNSVVSTLGWGNAGKGVAVAPDGSVVYGATYFGQRVHRIAPASNSSTGSAALSGFPGGLAITPDGGFLYVAIGPDQVAVVDTSTMTVGDTITVGTSPYSAAISPDGSRAYVPNSGSDNVSVIDTATNAVVATVAVGDSPYRAAVNADGTRIYVTNHGSSTVSVISVDLIAPTVTITTPLEGDVYTMGQVVLADYACADEAGGSGLASCVGDAPDGSAIDTGSVGPKTFTVNAADNAGNPASETNAYGVVYDFSGFFPPVDNVPVFNVAKAGSAVPVKFSLNGNQGLNIFSSGFPRSQQITCDASATLDGIEETVTAGSSSLSYDASTDRYVYVWKTAKAWANTCRKLIVQLVDGADHAAYFRFR